MENPAFDLVRQILRSKDFLALTLDQQQATLNEVLRTGEITREELFKIIGEEVVRSKQIQETKELASNLEKLDYQTFLTIVLTGDIRGEKLLALCSGSPKLNEFCNRSFQLLNNQGVPAGPPQNQYLFRLLLDKKGIPIPLDKTPRKVYIEKSIGGKVLGFGSNYYGELGIGGHVTETRIIPVEIPNLDNIIQVSAGDYYSLCLNSQGEVWVFGINRSGQLGLEDVNILNVRKPVKVEFKVKIIQVSAGVNHCLYLDERNRVWVSGANKTGQLGLSDNKNRRIPTLIPNLNNIIQIQAKGHPVSDSDYSYSLCLDNQGKVWGFGNSMFAQLGLGTMNKINHPTLIPGLNNIIQISAGRSCSLCLDNRGKVWGFGSNSAGQLGIGDIGRAEFPVALSELNDIIQVACGYGHSLCLDKYGKVWSFGYNHFRQLGLNDENSRYTPTLIPNLTNIVQISAGDQFSLCLDNQGRVWGFGLNRYGQLGLTEEEQFIVSFYGPVLNPYLTNIIQVNCGVSHTLCIIAEL